MQANVTVSVSVESIIQSVGWCSALPSLAQIGQERRACGDTLLGFSGSNGMRH